MHSDCDKGNTKKRPTGTLRDCWVQVTCALAIWAEYPCERCLRRIHDETTYNLIMKKFILICIFPTLTAILSSCANDFPGATRSARQPDVFQPPPEPPAPSH